jgi:hypothetical protein
MMDILICNKFCHNIVSRKNSDRQNLEFKWRRHIHNKQKDEENYIIHCFTFLFLFR